MRLETFPSPSWVSTVCLHLSRFILCFRASLTPSGYNRWKLKTVFRCHEGISGHCASLFLMQAALWRWRAGSRQLQGLGQNLQRKGGNGELQPRVASAGKEMELYMLDKGERARQGGWMDLGLLVSFCPCTLVLGPSMKGSDGWCCHLMGQPLSLSIREGFVVCVFSSPFCSCSALGAHRNSLLFTEEAVMAKRFYVFGR